MNNSPLPKTILVHKAIGETPLEALHRLRTEQPELQNEKLAYAGRLDPMASGLLLVLVGEECKQRDHYQGLEKEYQFKILTGVTTDTYDILGLVTSIAEQASIDEVEKVIDNFPKNYEQKYPPYSAKTIGGRKMFELAREGKLDEATIPTKRVEIIELKMQDANNCHSRAGGNLSQDPCLRRDDSDGVIKPMGYESWNGAQLLQDFLTKIDKVTGDFRQEEIKLKWQEYFAGREADEFRLFVCSATVTSGTYIRTLVHDIGQILKTGAIAVDIHRTRLGEFALPVVIPAKAGIQS